MFVRYYLELPLPFEEVEEAILRSPPDWIPGVALEAEARGELLLAEVGFGPSTHRLEKQVQIELGKPFRLASKTVRPMEWRATGAESLFPSLEADLEVAAMGGIRTQLSLNARYRPPLGPVGKVIDKTLLHRVAEATIKDFLDRLGDTLTAPSADPHGPQPALSNPGADRTSGSARWEGSTGRCDACGASFAVGSAHDAHRPSQESVASGPETE